MEGPISFWGYKEQESNLILPEHDDDDDDDDDNFLRGFIAQTLYTMCTRINCKILPVTNLAKYLHCGTNGTEKYVYKHRCKYVYKHRCKYVYKHRCK